MIFPLLASLTLATVNGLIVKTKTGPVEGLVLTTPLDKSVQAFLGIPYGEAPTGNSRFKPPVPVKPWSTIFKARQKGKSCVQFAPVAHIYEGWDWWVPPVNETSEDCLNLNIWVPDPVPKDAAVMVWIHGGGFEGGTGNSDKYDGQIIASEGDVIVASMNYRLGPLGFLYLDDVESPGNMGLMDQTLALKWIQDNIEAFGGDKNKVTIFGESAGGASSSFHLTIPASHGLFQRVVALSGTSNAVWATNDKYTAAKIGERLAHSTKCDTNVKVRGDMVDCLRTLATEHLVRITMDNLPDQILAYVPVIDGVYLEDESEKLIEIVDKDIEVMLGTTTEDGLILQQDLGLFKPEEYSYVDSTRFMAHIMTTLGLKDNSHAKFVQYFYTDWGNPEDLASIRKQAIHFATDWFFLCDMNRLNDLLSRRGNKIFRYKFGHHPSIPKTPNWMGSGHGDELAFIFGWPIVKENGYEQNEVELSRTMIKLWTNFAKYGDPNSLNSEGKFIKKWPKYSIKGREHVLIDDSLDMKVGSTKDLRIQECTLYDKILPHYLQASDGT